MFADPTCWSECSYRTFYETLINKWFDGRQKAVFTTK